jgi:hypothetical protein
VRSWSWVEVLAEPEPPREVHRKDESHLSTCPIRADAGQVDRLIPSPNATAFDCTGRTADRTIGSADARLIGEPEPVAYWTRMAPRRLPVPPAAETDSTEHRASAGLLNLCAYRAAGRCWRADQLDVLRPAGKHAGSRGARPSRGYGHNVTVGVDEGVIPAAAVAARAVPNSHMAPAARTTFER